ncbi:uncharacterized protein LOC119279533 [Triticum dicoccoides]|uniref:uncharacterized protein LOC119279533 n=1 Tax=Triticum dicoccoides TaxID=85692 RepID=UPI00188FD525|nr:uncharacterized protein LOC119279533 [Triticum dicoccoides]
MDQEDENQGLSDGVECEQEFEVSLSESEGRGHSPEGQPVITSRLSVKHVVETVAKFDEYERWLVSEIGFGGILKLPMHAKLDLKMSAWVMRKVNARRCVIEIDEDKKIGFTAEDFHKVFGIPCGNRDVCGRDAQIADGAIHFIKRTIGMEGSVAGNLKVAESFVNRDISEDSSNIERDCFQIALVIFVMGYLVASCTKHVSMTIDFWGALANPELISQFNWCEYAIQKLMSAVLKVQSDFESKAGTVHLFGCHVFFQIFLLDNIELGMFNMPHFVLPHVQRFEQKILGQMIIMAYGMKHGKMSYVPAGVRPADLVCYSRPELRSEGCIGGDMLSASGKQSSSGVPNRVEQRTPDLYVRGSMAPPVLLGDARSAYHSFGPRDFANHLRQTCQGDPVLEELSLMLKQQNAKCTMSMSLMRSRMQSDMLCFADRIVSLVQERCRCCQKRGRSKCITLDGSLESDEGSSGLRFVRK